jgi:hypothetical protein
MRRFLQSLVFCTALISILPQSGGAQTLFMPDTLEVESLSAIYSHAGRVFPTTSYPVSKAELSAFADMLAAHASDRTSQELESYRNEVLRYQAEEDTIAVHAAGSFEYTYRSQNVQADPGLPTELQVMDLHRLFLDKLPLVSLQLDYARDGGFEIGIAAVVQREYFLDPFSPTNLWESDPGHGNPLALENQDIMRGFLWYDFHPLQVELGRDSLQMGSSKSSLLPSPEVPFLDMLRIRLPLGRLTGDLVISTLENRPGKYDVTVNPGDPQFGPSIILTAIHRWEYAFDTVRVGIAAMCVYARDGNAFNLGDIFPVFSWHQADIGPNNTSFIADVTWVPLPGLTLSLQGGLDDVNLSGVGVQDAAAPTIPAIIFDADYLWDTGSGLSLDFGLELGYTHYLWGNFSLDTGYKDSLARAIDRYRLDGGTVILPLTSPYGPGATWVNLAATLHGLPSMETTATLGYFSRMTNPATGAAVTLLEKYISSSAIESAPHVDTWSAGLSLNAFPFGFLKVIIQPTMYIQVDNRSGSYKTWLDLALGVSVVGESRTRLAQHL